MPRHALFALGTVVATPGALERLQEFRLLPFMLLLRHQYGDWGDMETEDKAANDAAIANGSRIFSAYKPGQTETTLWVITEADRSSTCILTPDEY
jgi:hypothetical protein